MTITQAIGGFLLALPFVLVFGFIVCDLGWKAAAGIFGATAAIVAAVALGAFLVTGTPL